MREKLIDVFMHLDRHIQNRDEYGICYTSDFVEAVETVLAMLKNQDANGVTVQQWIPVTERLPEPGADVLVCGSRGGIYNAYLCRVTGDGYQVWHKRNSKSHYCMPTHWMPLPQAPKEG